MPDGLVNVDTAAFQSCSSLTSITMPDGVTSIGSRTDKTDTGDKNTQTQTERNSSAEGTNQSTTDTGNTNTQTQTGGGSSAEDTSQTATVTVLATPKIGVEAKSKGIT